MAKALGVDVGEARKGLDAVLMSDERQVLERRRHLRLDELAETIELTTPDMIAVDSPPAWATGTGVRAAERALLRLGVHSYATPPAARSDHPFYRWMRQGFAVFEIAERAGYPRYREGSVWRTAAEVFPHASAVVLAGTAPPVGIRKTAWRRSVLAAQGVPVDALTTADQTDAALAALTGVLALEGTFIAPGDPADGVIVLPARSLPTERYRRPDRITERSDAIRA
ncbi:MAG: DUF429 domain-containing protein [Actinomycetota bacterium]